MQSNDFYLLIYWNNLLGSRISKVFSNREDLFEYLNQNFIVSDKDTIDNVIDFGEPIRINDNSYYYVKQVPFIQGQRTVRPGDYVCILANKLDKAILNWPKLKILIFPELIIVALVCFMKLKVNTIGNTAINQTTFVLSLATAD